MHDFLFITDDETLAHRLGDIARSAGWHRPTVSGFDDALELFESRLFKAVFTDIRAVKTTAGAGRGLRLLEWMGCRRPFTRHGVFTDRIQAEKSTPTVLAGTDDFIGDVDLQPEKLRPRLAGVLERYPAWRAGLVHETTAGDGATVSWVGISAGARLALDKALSWASQPGIIAIAGDTGSGRKNLARVISSAAGVRDVALFSSTGKSTVDDEIEAWRLCLAGCDAMRRAVIVITDPLRASCEWQASLATLMTAGVRDPGREWLKVILVLPTGWRSSTLSRNLSALLQRNEIRLAALNERREDIPLLADHFLANCARDPETVPCLAHDALTALTAYAWPGQVAELREAIRSAVGKAGNGVITARDLPIALLKSGFYVAGTAVETSLADLPYFEAKKMALNKFNQEYIFTLLGKSAGNLTVAAELAGMDRSNFKKIVKKHFPEGVREK